MALFKCTISSRRLQPNRWPCHVVSVTFPRADVAEPITVACDCIIRKQIKTFFLSFSLSFEIAEVRFYMYTIYQSLHLNLLHISNDYLLLDCLRFWAVDPVEPIVHWFNINPIHQGAEFPFNQSSVFTYYQIRSLIDCIII